MWWCRKVQAVVVWYGSVCCSLLYTWCTVLPAHTVWRSTYSCPRYLPSVQFKDVIAQFSRAMSVKKSCLFYVQQCLTQWHKACLSSWLSSWLHQIQSSDLKHLLIWNIQRPFHRISFEGLSLPVIKESIHLNVARPNVAPISFQIISTQNSSFCIPFCFPYGGKTVKWKTTRDFQSCFFFSAHVWDVLGMMENCPYCWTHPGCTPEPCVVSMKRHICTQQIPPPDGRTAPSSVQSISLVWKERFSSAV